MQDVKIYRSVAELRDLSGEARRRFQAAVKSLNLSIQAARESGDLVKQCELVMMKCDLIKAYGCAIDSIFHG